MSGVSVVKLQLTGDVITLPAVSLASFTSDHTFSVRIPQTDSRVHLSTTTAQITYRIARNPAVNPTP